MTLLGRDLLGLIGDRQRFDDIYHEAPREVAADQAQHLMIVECRYHLVVRSRVEHLLDLLQEALAVESCGAHKRVLSQQDVLSLQSGIETAPLAIDSYYSFRRSSGLSSLLSSMILIASCR